MRLKDLAEQKFMKVVNKAAEFDAGSVLEVVAHNDLPYALKLKTLFFTESMAI